MINCCVFLCLRRDTERRSEAVTALLQAEERSDKPRPLQSVPVCYKLHIYLQSPPGLITSIKIKYPPNLSSRNVTSLGPVHLHSIRSSLLNKSSEH